MLPTETALDALCAISGLTVRRNVPLSQYTRFGIGGPALVLADAAEEKDFLQALTIAKTSAMPLLVIGGGTNLIVSDSGFAGIVLRYTGAELRVEQQTIHVDAGVVLQRLVDFSIEHGLAGLHTMTGIPGWTGAAIYGNAGAYGHSIAEFVREVRYFDGTQVRSLDQAGCEFLYRESIFKRHKDWIILAAELRLDAGDREQLRAKAAGILEIRNAKYPPTMKCAGSIFKNLILRELPAHVQSQVPAAVVREGKVPSAWFLEQAGAKGLTRGGMEVAAYHANLIYNTGTGTAAELCGLIQQVKEMVKARFGFDLEEEVQYVGF